MPSHVIYEHGQLSLVAPFRDRRGRPGAAVVIQTVDGVASLIQTFDADSIDGLAAAVLHARAIIKPEAAEALRGVLEK